MTALCGHQHPDLPLACTKSVDPGRPHSKHQARLPDGGVEEWSASDGVAAPARRADPQRLLDARQAYAEANPSVPTGGQLAAQAIAEGDAAASEEFRRQAREALRYLVTVQETLIAEDLRPLIDAQTHDNRAFGAVMQWGAGQGLVEKTERFQEAVTPGMHRAPKRVWRSLVYAAPVAPERVLVDYG